jgi:guanidinoacetate N-methyltransferase
MIQRSRKLPDFDIVLKINNDAFMNTPRVFQKNWLINRSLDELVDDLLYLDKISPNFMRGSDRHNLQTLSHEQKIMEDWQIPLMQAMASIVTETHGDILEVGFGRGISASYIQEFGVHSHTIVECNEEILNNYHTWKAKYPGRDIRCIHGRWQDVLDSLGMYDGIFFHTNVNNEKEFIDYVVQSVTFAEHFFPIAASHLKNGGIFTYLTHEIDSFSRRHQRAILRHFHSITLSRVPLSLPDDSHDLWWADSMVVVKAVR